MNKEKEKNVLSDVDIEYFESHGWVLLKNAINQSVLKEELEAATTEFSTIDLDTMTSTTGGVRLPTFSNRYIDVKTHCPRVWNAICQLAGGEQRLIVSKCNTYNNAIVRISQPTVTPKPDKNSWHVDGWHRLHYLNSPDVGVVVLWLFSDVEPSGGGTHFATDSISHVAKLLRNHPDGIPAKKLHGADSGTHGLVHRLLAQCSDFEELVCAAGDVALVHPFMIHAGCPNSSKRHRFLARTHNPLREPLKFDYNCPETMSPIERCVMKALCKHSGYACCIPPNLITYFNNLLELKI